MVAAAYPERVQSLILYGRRPGFRAANKTAERAVSAHAGWIVDRTGDGLMAAFEGPVGAIRAARRLQLDARELDLQVRAGLHIGEVREDGGLLRGLAVHAAARVMSEAEGGEILVSKPFGMSWRAQTSASVIAGPAS
jgi:class 3 adenylate cyclase